MAGKLGMGLLETLLENLDRDLNLANSTLTNPIITTSAAVTTSGVRTHDSLIPKRVTKFDLGTQFFQAQPEKLINGDLDVAIH